MTRRVLGHHPRHRPGAHRVPARQLLGPPDPGPLLPPLARPGAGLRHRDQHRHPDRRPRLLPPRRPRPDRRLLHRRAALPATANSPRAPGLGDLARHHPRRHRRAARQALDRDPRPQPAADRRHPFVYGLLLFARRPLGRKVRTLGDQVISWPRLLIGVRAGARPDPRHLALGHHHHRRPAARLHPARRRPASASCSPSRSASWPPLKRPRT